jgi:hypothetical protein
MRPYILLLGELLERDVQQVRLELAAFAVQAVLEAQGLVELNRVAVELVVGRLGVSDARSRRNSTYFQVRQFLAS